VQPNIGRAGRIARAISGVLCIALSLVGLTLGWPEPRWLRYVLACLLIATGGFQLFEARRGWCVVRACGLRTPL